MQWKKGRDHFRPQHAHAGLAFHVAIVEKAAGGDAVITHLRIPRHCAHHVAINPPADVISRVQVTVDGQPADVLFAGLTPGGVGLYQINFVVPASARSGNLDVEITQEGAKANTTKLLVGR